MYKKHAQKGMVTFAVKPQGRASKVLLAGDFNHWKPVTMRKQQDGSFVAEVAAAAGTYQYKFLIDGQWTTDPDNGNCVANPFGTANSVAVLG